MTICNDCKKQASFNYSGEKPKYCKSHSLDGMVDVVSKRCVAKDCKKQPNYNYKDLKQRLYCKEHKLDGMVDIKNKRCIEPTCDKQPTCNYKGLKQKLYCSEHKLEDMVDIAHKRCIEPNCDKIPNYNYKGEKQKLYCSEHKLEDMVDISNKRCIEPNCDKQPIYNYKGLKQGLYCSEHKLDSMIDIKHKLCKLCDMTRPSLNGYCRPCFYFTFPENAKTKNHKTRENAFMQPLKELYPDMILDKKISGGCSSRRPDGLIDCYTHCLVIEIDENQHINYSCENKRTMEIFQDLGCRPVVYIRLNPDSYTTGDKRHKSAFVTTKATGILSPVEKEFSKRFNTLLEEIEKQKKTIPEKTISTIQLYYSN